MKKRYQFSIDVINIIELHMLVTSISFVIYAYTGTPFPPIQMLVMGGYLVVSYLLNRICHHLIPFVIAQSLYLCSLFLLPLPTICMVFTTLLCIFIVICNVYFWMYRNDMTTLYPPNGFLIVIIVSFIYTLTSSNRTIISLNYNFGIFYTCGFLLRSYLEQLLVVASSQNIQGYAPISSIVRRNNSYVFSILGTFLALNFLLEYTAIESLFRWIVSGIGSLFKWLIRLFITSMKSEVEELPSPTVTPLLHNPLMQPIEHETNSFVQALDRIVFSLLSLAVVAAFFLLLLRIFQYIRKYYMTKNLNVSEPIDEFATIEIKEKISRPVKSSYHSSPASNMTNQQVRHLYRSRILSFKKQGYIVNNSDTPSEREKDIKEKTNLSILQLTHLYNRARYSDHVITKDELTQIKNDD